MKNTTTHFIMFATGIACSAIVNAQSDLPFQATINETGTTRCGQEQYENYLRSIDPKFDMKRAEVEKTIQAKAAEMEAQKNSSTVSPDAVYTIPIVYHVIYNTSAENVSDAEVQAMHAQLNMDWSRTNTDAGNTPSAWQSIASDMEIQFCLATKDPSGAPTTGIVHTQTSATSFDMNDDMKYTTQGGDDAWDVSKYLNIWICNLGGGILGYANFPPVASNYGTVVHYITVGSLTMPNSAGGAFGYGRTLSHEIGHNFTFNHIWDGGCPANGDGILDTPGQSGPTSGCPTFPALDGCQTASPGFMFMNYMDYTDDLCYNMFTAGQKARAQSTIASYLMSLVNNTANGCSLNTDVNQMNIDEHVSVYPNPVSESATIFSEMQNCPVKIFDLTGNIVKDFSNVNQFPFTIERKNLTSGMYFLELRSENKTERIKLMVQ